jgi:AAHS family 4-hydroxybenzoate transporter-like MFS transporter
MASKAIPTGIIDASAVIERQRPGRFVLRLVVLSILITFFDGFDMNVIAYAAPYMKDEFALDQVRMGYIFTAGTLGIMIGGFLFGYLGDRFGRRWTIIAAAGSFGLLSLLLAAAWDYPSLLILRFLGGLGMGGLLPLCWALNIEYVPRRFRATVVTVVMLGYTLGGSLGAPMTMWLAPQHGWQGVFVFGGVASLAVTLLLAFGLPESIRYLIVKEREGDRVEAYLRAIEPGLEVPPNASFVLVDERTDRTRFSPARLFEGRLLWVTPLIWIAYTASSLTIYFKATWTPLVLELLGYTRSEAAVFSSVSSIGVALGGLLLMRFVDRLGAISIAVISALAVPVLVYSGLWPTGFYTFLWLNLLATIMVGGAHFGMISLCGIFYPSSFRANGAGWAASIAKLGAIAGPLLGGFILATSFPVKFIFALLAIAPAILAVVVFVLTRRLKADKAIPPALPATA